MAQTLHMSCWLVQVAKKSYSIGLSGHLQSNRAEVKAPAIYAMTNHCGEFRF